MSLRVPEKDRVDTETVAMCRRGICEAANDLRKQANESVQPFRVCVER